MFVPRLRPSVEVIGTLVGGCYERASRPLGHPDWLDASEVKEN
jgi:hypothetical protein